MSEEKKKPETSETKKDEEKKAPIEEICADSEKLAKELVDDDSEIEPTEGFFFTSQRWH